MQDEQPAYRHIDTRFAALLAFGISAAITATHIRDLWIRHSPRTQWIDEFRAILPAYTWIAINILGFCIVVFAMVNFVQECRGAERIYFAVFLFSVLLEPLRFLRVTLAMIALCAQTAAALVMLFAAVWLLFSVKPQADAQSPPV